MAGSTELGPALRHHREACKLTQEQVAERAGLSVRTVSDLERGVHSSARRSTLERLARALGLSASDTARLLRSGDREVVSAPAQLPASLRPRPGQLPLVGRDAARAAFTRTWELARGGERAALVYSGEAGIGKSTLLATLGAEVMASGAVVLGGRCDDSIHAPYGAVIEALRPALRDELLESVLAAVGPDAGHLALVLPELASRVALPPIDADPGASRARLLNAFEALFASLTSAAGPVTLVIDDLHAADPSTLAVLRHLVRSARPEGFLLLAAYRSTEVTADHGLPAFFEELQRDQLLTRTDLTGLGADDLGMLVARASGEHPPAATIEALRRQTGGNPFFVEEVLTNAAEQGLGLEEALATVPSGARDVVRARVRRISPGARSALETAAVVGNTFEGEVVERVIGSAQIEGLHHAVVSGFVDAAEGTYSFRHGLVRAALLQDLGASELAAIHWRVGEALESVHAHDLDQHLDEIAHHLQQGAHAGDPVKASEYLARVGRQQFRAIALDEAVDSLTAALSVAPEVAADGRRRMSILETLAETHFWRDDPDAMRAAALAAADLARDVGTPEDLGRTVIVAARWNRGGELEGEVLDLLDEAVTRLGPIESGMLSQLLAMRAYVLQGAARGFDTRQLAEEAELMARRCEDTEALTMALLVQTYTEAGAPTVDRTRRIIADLEEVAARVPREDHRRQYGMMALRPRAVLQLMSADRTGYSATRAELETIGEAIHGTFLRSQLLCWDAAITRAEGRFSDADEISVAALANWSARPDAMRVFMVQSATSGLERGEHDEVLPELERIVAGNTSSIGYAWRAVLATGLAATGRTDEAAARLEDLAADKFRGLVADHQRPHALRWLSELIALLDRTEAAEALLPVIEPYSGLLLVGSGITTVECAADRAIGQLLATIGRVEDAEHHYERAVTLEAALGFEALELRTRYWSAKLRGDRALAATTAARSSELGMRLLAHAAGALVS